MEEGLDTGPMLLAEATPIGPRTTTPELHDRLAGIGARLILRALDEAPPATPQPMQGVTYAQKLGKADGAIDWRRGADALDRQVRALNPWPGCFFSDGAETLRLLAAEPAPAETAPAEPAPPGTRLPGGIVACGTGALRLLSLQRPGRAAQPADAFLRGHPLPARLP
jgi:methionyl-tRNA formyltransferase